MHASRIETFCVSVMTTAGQAREGNIKTVSQTPARVTFTLAMRCQEPNLAPLSFHPTRGHYYHYYGYERVAVDYFHSLTLIPIRHFYVVFR